MAGALRTEGGQVTMKWEEGGAVDVQLEGGLFRRTLFQGYGAGSGVPSPEPVRWVDHCGFARFLTCSRSHSY